MISERMVNLGSISLNHACSPENGPPLAMFHGVTRRWQTFLPLWTTLGTRWQLVAWDARGHGRSSRASDISASPMPNAGAGYQVIDYVSDAVDFVRQRFTQPTVLYGHSLGAMVALATAAAVPHVVRAVVLEDPPFNTMGKRIDETALLSFFAGLVPFAGHQRNIGVVAGELAELRINVTGKEHSARLGDSRDATALRFTARSLADLDPQVLQDIVAGQWLTGYDLPTILSKVQCPVLVLQADAACGAMLLDADAELLGRTLADCTVIRFPNAPHLIHWAQTELVLKHVLGFLESLPSPA